jgi:hypothetical protein
MILTPLVLLAVLPFALCSHDLSSTYQFNLTLVEGNYWLYWNFNPTTQRIDFAVRVRTTGWIGFGLSPNGQMPGSDVVIGWIDGSNTYFHDRYAVGRYTPPIDPVQNWFLTNAEQEDGYTILEFWRNFTSCDTANDLDILFETARIVYSWNDNKPTVNGPNSFTFERHTNQGQNSVNLIGGLPNPPTITENTESFVAGVNEIPMPNVSTTYWCAAIRLPSEVIQDEKYIIKLSPHITSGNEQYVHHILVYSCDSLEESDVGVSGPCHTISRRVRGCIREVLIGAWAVGGTDFVYPENVAFPIGGAGNNRFAVIEIHYNNPSLASGVIDSSGIEFTYINDSRQHDAGIMFLGHIVSSNMVIPPKAQNYTVTGLCSSACTNSLPPGGIHIFANTLHTHLAGTGLNLRHIRQTSCGNTTRTQEMEPIEKNLKYDFNFQQTSYLPNEITVLPGDTLILDCIYNTVGRTSLTVGGESTQEEMCLAFPIYYPKIDIKSCISTPTFEKLDDFIQGYIPSNVANGVNSQSGSEQIGAVLNSLEWTQEQINGFQRLIYDEASQYVFCGQTSTSSLPPICCGYETSNNCTGYQPRPCCQRECIDPRGIGGAGTISFSIALMILTVLLGTLFTQY